MSSLVNHAERELDLLGLKEGTDINGTMRKCILDLVTLFASQEHSGTSAEYCKNLLLKLLNFHPLTPLTGDHDEWEDVSKLNGGMPAWQNRRYPSLFRCTGGRYFFEVGTGDNSTKPIVFPYSPKLRLGEE